MKASTKKFARLHDALALRATQTDPRFERQQRRRIVGRRIGMRHAAADGAHVAHLHVADAAPPPRASSGHLPRISGEALDLMMRRHRADAHHAARFADVVQARDAAQIDQLLGRRQPQLHHRDQAHAAGQDLARAVREQAEGLLQTSAGA